MLDAKCVLHNKQNVHMYHHQHFSLGKRQERKLHLWLLTTIQALWQNIFKLFAKCFYKKQIFHFKPDSKDLHLPEKKKKAVILAIQLHVAHCYKNQAKLLLKNADEHQNL